MQHMYIPPEKPKYKKRRTHRTAIVLSIIASIVAVGVIACAFTGAFGDIFTNLFSPVSSEMSSEIFSSDPTIIEPEIVPYPSREHYAIPEHPTPIKSLTINPGSDIRTDSFDNATADIDSIVSYAAENGFNTIIMSQNSNNTAVFSTSLTESMPNDLTAYAYSKCTEFGLKLYAVFDFKTLLPQNSDFYIEENRAMALNLLKDFCISKRADGVIFDGLEYTNNDAPLSSFPEGTDADTYHTLRRTALTDFVKELCSSIKLNDPDFLLGLKADSVWAKKENDPNGIDVTGIILESLIDRDSDTLGWVKADLFDMVLLENHRSSTDGIASFNKIYDWWNENTENHAVLCTSVSAENQSTLSGGYSDPNELLNQIKYITENSDGGFTVSRYSHFTSDITGSSEAILQYLSGTLSENYTIKFLQFSTPKKTTLTTNESSIAISGACDPEKPLLMNGKTVELTENGYFSLQLDLKAGLNTYKFEHKGKVVTYNITYNRILIQSYTPDKNIALDGGTTFSVKAIALDGSTVSATFNGKTINLTKAKISNEDNADEYSDFKAYTGVFSLPEGEIQDKNLGQIVFKATFEGQTQSVTGKSITLNKAEIIEPPSSSEEPSSEPSSSEGSSSDSSSDASSNDSSNGNSSENSSSNDLSNESSNGSSNSSSVNSSDNTSSIAPPPLSSDYADVKAGKICEVVSYEVETFNGKTTDDLSRPTNNYLPAGTVDYCSTSKVYDSASNNYYYLLRSNYRVYSNSSVKLYDGTLPSTNKISVASLDNGGQHTTITLNVDWKAPFRLDVHPQSYRNPEIQDYYISSATYQYVDITFCYASEFKGTVDIKNSNPLFSRAEVIKNKSDYTLRLYLKKVGGFYGWSASYNSSGQLVFNFLNPAKISKANNDYGVSLKGVKIFVDAGHGGTDGGAPTVLSSMTEAKLTLIYAKKLRDKLESLGATVIMSRTSNTTLPLAQRAQMVRNKKPDLGVSIHFNSALNTGAEGYYATHFNAFTYNAAKHISDSLSGAGLKKYKNGVDFHYFRLSRMSDCPFVLTENGFVSNSTECNKLVKEDFQDKYIDLLVKGIVNYFKSINGM